MEEDLQNFHCLLKGLRADELQGQGRYGVGRSQPVYSSISKMKLDHLTEVSNVLFQELVRQFENFHALLGGPLDGVSGLDSKAAFTKERFIVLLRCCLMMLQFLEFDMSLLLEKCGILFKIISMFFPQNLVLNCHGCSVVSSINPFSQCCNCFRGGIKEEADQLLNFFPLILEVFIAELSENEGLRKHLISVNVLTANSEKLCECCNTHAGNCIILKLVFSHFFQLIRNDLDFSRFIHSLSGSSDIDNIIPEISLDTSLILVSTPFILSAPLIIQAHLILLASRCISTHLPIEGRKSDTLLMSCHINPFELSVNLYLSYLSTLQLDGVILGANNRSNLGDASVHKNTCDKLIHQANDLVDFSHICSESILSGTKSEVIAYSTSYIQENHPLIDQVCKKATRLVVDYIIKSIIPMEVWEQRPNEKRERIQQEVYCLAATMKLMNSSLLHSLCIWRQITCNNEMRAFRDSLPYMAYECLSQSASIIRVSGFGADQQVEIFLYDMLGAYVGMHQEIKFMLAHISSLLLFSFKRKLDFLWKGCISMMMTLMNLILLEERNLGLSKIFKLLQNPPSMYYEGLIYRSTSLIIARNLEKTRKLYLKNEITYVRIEENRTHAGERSEVNQQLRIYSVEGIETPQGNTCNGERFIKYDPSYHTNPSGWDGLDDFIECSPEKDYFFWLENRRKFNKWKQENSKLFKRRKKKLRTCVRRFMVDGFKEHFLGVRKGRKENAIKKVYNLRSRDNTSKGIEEKSQDQRSGNSRHQRKRGA